MLNNAMKRLARHLGPRPRGLSRRYPECVFGRGTYDCGDLSVRALGEATLRVGAFCSIASGVQVFLGGEHRTDWITTYPFSVLWPAAKHYSGHPATKGDVVIGSDVWIGTEAVILSGVTIGDGAVVGAHALVASDVSPYSIVAGNPAREIRKRFDDAAIQELLRIRWWDWPDHKIEKLLPLLLSDDTAAFVRAVKEHETERD